jgi:hypothetical protein
VRFRQEQKQRAALASLAGRYEERKLVDRAKGILMDTGGMPEAQAFRALRSAAMDGKVRLGQVAQRLIEAARSVEAINRAGQLRMLSQRLVKLCLLEALEVEPQSAQALRAVSIRRVEDNLLALGELLARAPLADRLDAVRAAWQGLERALRPAPGTPAGAPDLGDVDAAAQGLLDAAECLTAALEASSAVAGRELVNLAGRQRMLAQRAAKLALFEVHSGGARKAEAAQQTAALARDFDAALAALRAAPLTSGDERVLLDDAARAWSHLRSEVAPSLLAPAPLALARCSEELLDILDRLTESYENRLKLMIG